MKLDIKKYSISQNIINTIPVKIGEDTGFEKQL